MVNLGQKYQLKINIKRETQMKTPQKSIFKLLAGSGLAVALVLQAMTPAFVGAAGLGARSLTLSTATPSATGVTHTFNLTLGAGSSFTSLDAMTVTYCTTAAGTCTAPTGLSLTSATVSTDTGSVGSWSMGARTANTFNLTRTGAAATTGATIIVGIGTVTNPSAVNTTFFARVDVKDGGSTEDQGTVAASTSDPVVLNGIMPESLIFCTGETVSTTSSIPDCSTATSASDVDFDQLFSATETAIAFSQMAASTNAGTGYNITVNGNTLESGANSIAAIGGSATASAPGTAQFGLNLKANTSGVTGVGARFPGASANVSPADNASTFYGDAAGAFATADSFAFTAGSANTVATANANTDPQIYTVSYIANVSGRQPAGNYSTTLTYVCTPLF